MCVANASCSATGGALAEACRADQQFCAQGAMYDRFVQARRQQPDQAGDYLCNLASRLLGQVWLHSCARPLQLQQQAPNISEHF